MITYELFNREIDRFSQEFSGKGYTDRRKGILYKRLSYLTYEDFQNLLDIALSELPVSYLPSPSKLIEIASAHFKKVNPSNNTNPEEYCVYCENTGQIDAFLGGDLNKMSIFRCFCKLGDGFNEEYFPTWGKRLQDKYVPKYIYYADKR